MPNTAVKLLCAEDSEGFPLVKAGRCRSFFASLAQLDRAPDFGSGGWGFESLRIRLWVNYRDISLTYSLICQRLINDMVYSQVSSVVRRWSINESVVYVEKRISWLLFVFYC